MRVRVQMCSEIRLSAFRLLKPYRIPQCPLRDLFGALEALGTLASTLVRVRCDADGEQNVGRFRLHRHRFLQENTRFAAFFKIYQII